MTGHFGKDLFCSWKYLQFPSNFIVCPVEEKYKCTYYECLKDGKMRPVKTVVRTDLIFDESDLSKAGGRISTRKVKESFSF